MFLCYPVIYAASQLKPPAAITACMAAVTADAVVVLSLRPLTPALTDLFYVSAALLSMTALLIRAGKRQDELVLELRRQAAVDPLTGLATRRVLDDAVRTALTSDDSSGGTALGMVDIDRFKTVNDRHGHPIGDAALVHIAKILSRTPGRTRSCVASGATRSRSCCPAAPWRSRCSAPNIWFGRFARPRCGCPAVNGSTCR